MKRYEICDYWLYLFQTVSSDPSLVAVRELYLKELTQLLLHRHLCAGVYDEELAACFARGAASGDDAACDYSSIVVIDK